MIISPLKVWVQNVLPVVYDDSLSYLEIVAKINAKTNEIISQTNENTNAIETLSEVISKLGDIDELKELLNEIKTIVEDLYTTDVPAMDGVASAGSADHAARSDHVHPSDTGKANKDLNIDSASANQYVKILAVDENGKPTAFGSDTPSGGARLSDNNPVMNGTASAGSGNEASRYDHVHPSDTTRAPINHASNETTYGIGNANNYGHVKITDDINNTDNGTGIKPSAVKGVYDKLKTFTKDNMLDNWYFPNCVNQRGQSSYSNVNAYTIDRWKLTSGSVTVGTGGITLNGTLVQMRENAIGQPVVCSALLSDGTMIFPTYNDMTKTFTLTATGQTIVAVKMELGREQTLAHQENGQWVLNEIPNYQQEFMKCSRYLQVLAAYTRLPCCNMLYKKIDYTLPILPMIAVPTLSSGTWNISEIKIGADDTTIPFTVAANEMSSGCLTLRATFDDAYNFTELTKLTSETNVYLSAEL